MFRTCKYCKRDFEGSGYFCSDMCEIKNYVSESDLIYESVTIIPTSKEEFDPVKKENTETPMLDQSPTEVSLETQKPKSDKFNDELFH